MLNTTQTHITAAALEVLYEGQTSQENTIGEDRISYFLGLANATIETDFRDAIRDFKNAHKVGDKVPATINTRASEFQALYYANMNNISLVEMGYHAAIRKARESLEKMGLRTNGKPILSEEEKQANREKSLRRKAFKAAESVIDMGMPDAMQKLAEQAEQELAKLHDEVKADALAKKFQKVTTLVKSIMDEGDDYAIEVFSQLGAALGFELDLNDETNDLDFTEKKAA